MGDGERAGDYQPRRSRSERESGPGCQGSRGGKCSSRAAHASVGEAQRRGRRLRAPHTRAVARRGRRLGAFAWRRSCGNECPENTIAGPRVPEGEHECGPARWSCAPPPAAYGEGSGHVERTELFEITRPWRSRSVPTVKALRRGGASSFGGKPTRAGCAMRRGRLRRNSSGYGEVREVRSGPAVGRHRCGRMRHPCLLAGSSAPDRRGGPVRRRFTAISGIRGVRNSPRGCDARGTRLSFFASSRRCVRTPRCCDGLASLHAGCQHPRPGGSGTKPGTERQMHERLARPRPGETRRAASAT